MESHVRALAAIRIAFGALGLFGALVVLLVFGGAAGIIGTIGVAEDPDAIVAVPILAVIGTAILFLILLLSVPSIVAGVGLLSFRPWARILTIVLSALDLLNVPIGTMVGAYGLWVLTSRESEPLFRNASGGPQAWQRPAA